MSPVPVVTFGELFALYFERHIKVRAKNKKDPQYFLNVHGERWRDVPITSMSLAGIQNWLDETGETRGIHAANRAVNIMAAAFEWGRRRGFATCPNPCVGVERFTVRSRERFLSPEEMDRFTRSLDKEPANVRDLFYLFLFTGARCGNVMAMKWDQVDLDLALWTIPETKNGDSHVVPLTARAIELLRRRRSDADGDYVFPRLGRRPTSSLGHVKDVRRAFRRVVQRAGINDLRIHDLRRTVASYMAINGASSFIIAAMLGHKDQRSTSVYARLNVAPVKAAIETAVSGMFGVDVDASGSALKTPAFVPSPDPPCEEPIQPTAEGAALQRAEGILLRVLERTQSATKSHFHRSLGPSSRVSANDLEWLLQGLIARGMIVRKVMADGVTAYSLTELAYSALRLRRKNGRLIDSLSKRQKEIILLLIQQKTNAEIAESLGLTLHTVKAYVKDVFTKMKARNRQEAAAIALRELAA